MVDIKSLNIGEKLY